MIWQTVTSIIVFTCFIITTHSQINTSECSKTNCRRPDCGCFTPQNEIRKPQLVIVSLDDTISQEEWSTIWRSLSNSSRDQAGCLPRLTIFWMKVWSDFHVANQAAAQGHEIACHTATHNTGDKTTREQWLQEISASKECFWKLAGISNMTENWPSRKSFFKGMRAPYLLYNAEMLSAQKESGMIYDSSMLAFRGLTENSFTVPFTFDFGMPNLYWLWFAPGQAEVPGLWELPLYDMYRASSDIVEDAMDPRENMSATEVGELLEWNFQMHYNENRGPFIIPWHPFRLMEQPERLQVLRDFLSKVAQLDDVFFATIYDAIEWSRNPKSVFEYLQERQSVCSMINDAVQPKAGKQEICNGIDDDGNGLVDEGLTHMCSYITAQGYTSFSTCSPTCPLLYDTLSPC